MGTNELIRTEREDGEIEIGATIGNI